MYFVRKVFGTNGNDFKSTEAAEALAKSVMSHPNLEPRCVSYGYQGTKTLAAVSAAGYRPLPTGAAFFFRLRRGPDKIFLDTAQMGNGPRTDPAQTPNGFQTPSRTDPERTPNGSRTDLE